MNGSVTPVSGISAVTPPTITNTCSAKTHVRPVASSFENESRARLAILQTALDDQQVDAEQADGADEARLVDDHGVDEVGVRRRHERADRGVAAVAPRQLEHGAAEALAEDAAVGLGEQSLRELVAAAASGETAPC